MPMQPRPSFETSRPCVPSLRLSMPSRVVPGRHGGPRRLDEAARARARPARELRHGRHADGGASRVAIVGGRSWPSRSGKPPSLAATSAARRTRSARRRSTSVRPAASRSVRIASARPAAPTGAARSSRSGSRRRSSVTRIAVDAMGGDRGPSEIVAGAASARRDGIEPILFGPAGLDTHGLELREAPETIAMHEKPAEAVRAKPNSSLVAAVRAVADGDAAAAVSAGNTGAVLAAGLLELRRLPGVLRPAIAVPIPAKRGPSVLIDAGANADARPEHLLQFALMGAVFAEE